MTAMTLLFLVASQVPLDLEACVSRALAAPETVELLAARAADAASFQRQAHTWPNPVFSYTVQDLGLAPAGQAPLVQQQMLSFPVFFPYTRLQEGRVANAGMAQAHAGIEEERRNIRLQVGRAYFDQLLAEQTVQLEEEGAALALHHVEQARRRQAIGDEGETGVQRAVAEHLDAVRTLDLARRRRDQGGLAFSALLGDPVPTVVVLAPSWDARDRRLEALVKEGLDALHARVLGRRADVRAARAALQRAQEQRMLEERKLLPLADVQLAVGARQSALGTGAVLSLSAPVPAFDRNQGPRERAAAGVHAAHAVLARVERAALAQADAALLDWQQSRAAVDRWARPAVEARTAAMEGVERQFTAGTVGLQDVIQARRDVLSARRALLQAQRDGAVAAVQLAAALGLE